MKENYQLVTMIDVQLLDIIYYRAFNQKVYMGESTVLSNMKRGGKIIFQI